MKVCDICGAMQAINDTEKRNQTHLEGKVHTGFALLRKELDKLSKQKEIWKIYADAAQKQDREKSPNSKSKEPTPRARDRSRSRSDDRRRSKPKRSHRRDRSDSNSRTSRKRKHAKSNPIISKKNQKAITPGENEAEVQRDTGTTPAPNPGPEATSLAENINKILMLKKFFAFIFRNFQNLHSFLQKNFWYG
jgi:hypothetical protein